MGFHFDDLYGDPFIEWNEEISAREGELPEDQEIRAIEGAIMELQELKDAVIKVLVTGHDFTHEEATEKVDEHAGKDPDMWTENAIPESLASFLASDDDDD